MHGSKKPQRVENLPKDTDLFFPTPRSQTKLHDISFCNDFDEVFHQAKPQKLPVSRNQSSSYSAQPPLIKTKDFPFSTRNCTDEEKLKEHVATFLEKSKESDRFGALDRIIKDFYLLHDELKRTLISIQNVPAQRPKSEIPESSSHLIHQLNHISQTMKNIESMLHALVETDIETIIKRNMKQIVNSKFESRESSILKEIHQLQQSLDNVSSEQNKKIDRLLELSTRPKKENISSPPKPQPIVIEDNPHIDKQEKQLEEFDSWLDSYENSERFSEESEFSSTRPESPHSQPLIPIETIDRKKFSADRSPTIRSVLSQKGDLLRTNKRERDDSGDQNSEEINLFPGPSGIVTRSKRLKFDGELYSSVI